MERKTQNQWEGIARETLIHHGDEQLDSKSSTEGTGWVASPRTAFTDCRVEMEVANTSVWTPDAMIAELVFTAHFTTTER